MQINDEELRRRMLSAIAIYQEAITPSTIYLSEVLSLAKISNVKLSTQEALDILTSAALDIDMNYASEAIEYHFNDFVSNTQ